MGDAADDLMHQEISEKYTKPMWRERDRQDFGVVVYCCGCQKKVKPRLTDGKEIYPNRSDLHSLPFWKCDACGNHVGCHHKTIERTKPLGCIPTPEIKNARRHIHQLLDPIWQSGKVSRSRLYGMLSKSIAKQYHTAEIQSVEEARVIYREILNIKRSLD